MTYIAVESPNAPRPTDPVIRDMSDGLMRIEAIYNREGSGPGSRFEGKLLEDVQAEWVYGFIARRIIGFPVLTPSRLSEAFFDVSEYVADRYYPFEEERAEWSGNAGILYYQLLNKLKEGGFIYDH
jgi:hypothetical protein